MEPKAHLFVVDNDTMPIHIQKGFCGIVKVDRLNRAGNLNGSYFGQIADLMNIAIGDLVFFYMLHKKPVYTVSDSHQFDDLQQGYYGVFKVVGNPFSSDSQIKGSYPFENHYFFGSINNSEYQDPNQRYRSLHNNNNMPVFQFRIPIEPIDGYNTHFHCCSVDDNHAYVDRTDEGNLNTLLYKKIKRIGEERSITPILPEEASKIARLIFKQSAKNYPVNIANNGFHRLGTGDQVVELDIEFDTDSREVKRESMLEAYILRAFNNNYTIGDLSDAIGSYDDIEFCGNQIQYGISGNKVDILLLHRSVLGGSTAYRYRATVIELKKGRINRNSIEQIVDYQKWIAQLVTYNNISAIQPILVGKKPSMRMTQENRDFIRSTLNRILQSEISPPIFIEYCPQTDNSIDFLRFQIEDVL